MYRYGILLYGFLVRRLIELWRYPLEFVGAFASYLLIFLVIFYGGEAIAPDGFEENLDAIVIGYFLLVTAFSTFFRLSALINTEAKYGTLQQLYIAPFRFPVVMCSAVLAQATKSLLMGVSILAVMVAITPVELDIDLLTIVPIMASVLVHAIGLSFLLGGLALLYKRIRSLYPLVQYAMLGIISLAITVDTWPRFLPLGQGAAMLHLTMSRGVGLLGFPPIDHAILVTTSVLYFAIGYLTFHLAQYRARQHGLLDDY